MTSKPEYRAVALRFEEERRLSGTIVRYGEVARIAGGIRERIAPGAFGDLSAADVILNAHHDRKRPLARAQGGGLELLDTAEALRMTAELPATAEAADVLNLVRARILRGLSVEMHVLKESRQLGIRVVERAVLADLAVVDRPAYVGSAVEARADAGEGEGLPALPWWQL